MLSADTLTMSDHSYLSNQLLIAMPTLADDNFSQTVTLICEHTEQGALGIILNKPLKMCMGEIFDQLSLHSSDTTLCDQLVLWGGPVQPARGFVIHRAGSLWDSTLVVSDSIHVTTSRDVLQSIAAGKGPSPMHMVLGYAGWDAGQLEAEMAQNAWLTAPFNEQILFDTPYDQRWYAAANLLGVNLTTLSTLTGHA